MHDTTTPRSRHDTSVALGRSMKFATVSLGVAAAWIVLELALRLVPHVISPRLLILFEPGLRSDIAAGAFPLEKDFRRIDRDDNGPPLLVANPNSRIVSLDEPADRAVRYADEAGFCNPPGRYAGHDRIDVIAIGDSFTWCHAILPAQAWPALVGDRLGVSSFGLGLGGNGPYEYLQILREFGLAKHPRVVIMNIYGGNDLRDAAQYLRYRAAVEDGEDPPSEKPQPIAPALAASIVGRHSYALNLLLAFATRVVGQGASDWERTGVDFHYAIAGGDGPIPFNVENRDRDEVVAARHLEDASMSPEIWEDALVRFVALAGENGFAPIVSYTPSAFAVYAGHLRFADPRVGPLVEHLDEVQRSYLAERASSLGYTFYDLTPSLREAARNPLATNLLYDPATMHFSARGQDVVADSMTRMLAARGLGRSDSRPSGAARQP